MKAVTFSSSLVVIITSINMHIALQERITQDANNNESCDFSWQTTPEKTIAQLYFDEYKPARVSTDCSRVNDWNAIDTTSRFTILSYSSSRPYEYGAP